MTTLGDHHMDRQSFVMAVGGGSVLDMVGFATALVHRGLRFIRVPTTVLSQNDAGVGVKNGMNERETKNFVGAFAPPFAVINDYDFLSTLSDKDWTGGIFEAFKVAIIKDSGFFEFLCENARRLRDRNKKAMEELVYRCAVLHLEHIKNSGDPFEFGSSRPLDFGHWSGHKLEVLSGFTLGHGQAIGIGIALDCYIASKLGLLSEAERDRIFKGFMDCGLSVWSPFLEKRDSSGKLFIIEGLEEFREHLGGSLTLAMPNSLGHQCEINQLDEDLIEEGIAFLKKMVA
jgi:3-dehydroquinate synthase